MFFIGNCKVQIYANAGLPVEKAFAGIDECFAKAANG
jgi:hypothetical protein